MIYSFAGKLRSLYSGKFILSLEIKYDIDEYLDLGIKFGCLGFLSFSFLQSTDISKQSHLVSQSEIFPLYNGLPAVKAANNGANIAN